MKKKVCQKETKRKRVWYHKNESHSAVHPGTPTIKISCDLLPGDRKSWRLGTLETNVDGSAIEREREV